MPTLDPVLGAPLLAAVFAAIQAGVLIRSFVVALVIVSPFWLHRRRRARRSRGPATTEAVDPSTPTAPRLEEIIAGIDRAAGPGDATTTVRIPTGVTVDGIPVDAATADALVRDALRRGGLVAVDELDTPTGRILECRPVGGIDR